jgi:hypothetical protein
VSSYIVAARLTPIPIYTKTYAPIKPYPVLFVALVTGSTENVSARCNRSGWQKFRAARRARGGRAAQICHLNVFIVARRKVFGPLCVTRVF